MEKDNQKILVSLQTEKAKRFLTQADEMANLKHWDLAANRYYYACFHAVQALFIAKGVNAHTHAGINTQFSLHFVKTGVVDISYGSFLARMFQLRQKADYNCAYEVSESEVQEIVELTHNFVKTIISLIVI
ncbi:HEPN domain-containing protein [uncultured Prevotella sp.]|jgi:putative toxin-antitoxin system, antitoxin component|uniref:HEPN domain-containing protein n=1 Tax=Prevotella sp. TaxID=59823 RepID=UPI0025E9EB63|nr:HEPN domain-containing protein [uncultured Prevotella sp.]